MIHDWEFTPKKKLKGLQAPDLVLLRYFLVSTRRLVIQSKARKTVAIARTTSVAIGMASETRDTGVYAGNAIEIAAPTAEKRKPS